MYYSLPVNVFDTIPEPISPKPLYSNVLILNIVISNILVFICPLSLLSESLLGGSGFFKGFSAKLYIISIIFFIGLITIYWVSLLNVKDATANTKQVNIVVENCRIASYTFSPLLLKRA